VILENAADAAAAYPDLWANRETAKSAFRKGRLGTILYRDITYTGKSPTSVVQVDYQRKGAGRSPASAWFDPGIVPRDLILRWLTKRLGELAWHAVQAAQTEPSGSSGEGEGKPSGSERRPRETIVLTPAEIMFLTAAQHTDVIIDTIDDLPDTEKMAMRARLQARAAPAYSDGVAREVTGGYGDLIDPGELELFGTSKRRYPHPPGSSMRPIIPDGVMVIMMVAA
jgi:hypothetical protein